MSWTQLLAIDPGMSTGVVWGVYSDTEPFKLEGRTQVEGGRDATRDFLEGQFSTYTRVVCEKFRALPRVYKAVELEPLPIEGVVTTLFVDVVWQYPGAMTIGGAHGTPAKNKRAADDVLRRMGLWTTGSQIGFKDANDVNSAMKHVVAYLKGISHRPTLEALGVEL